MPASEADCTRRTRRDAQRAARREKFIACAEKLFLRDGYAGTSVNTVVRLAGGSLATLYSEFGTKEALFEAVIARRAASAFPPEDPSAPRPRTARARLHALASRIHTRTISATSLGIFRLAISEGPRRAGVRQAVLEQGLDAFLGHLGEILSGMHREGLLLIDDPALAASRFLALVQGQHQFIGGCGARDRLPAEIRTRHIEGAVQAFLALYGIDATDRARPPVRARSPMRIGR